MKFDKFEEMLLVALVVVSSVGSVLAERREFPSTEFGGSVNSGFNYEGSFRSPGRSSGRNITSPVAGADHEYDDGYNRVDNLGNFGDATSYWGYNNSSQFDPVSRTVNMSASHTTASGLSMSDSDSFDPNLGFSIYWKQNLLQRDGWALGVKTSLRWQRIELDSSDFFSTETRTVVDQYDYLPPSPYPVPPGGYQGPYTRGQGNTPMLSDSPNRISDSTQTSKLRASRSLDADLYALDIGPALSIWLLDDLSLVASVAGTIAYIDSELSYRDQGSSSGTSSDDDWLFGLTTGVDIQYWVKENWGVYAGAAYNYLEDFEQNANGHQAEIDFSGCYDLHAGVFWGF